jgi:hypothetical protein
VLENETVRVGLLIFSVGAGIALALLAYYPAEAPSTIISIVSSATASFAGAYVSYAVIARHLLGTERERIDPAETVCERYDETLQLLEPTAMSSTVTGKPAPRGNSDRAPSTLPCVIEVLDVTDILSAEVTTDASTYDFPPSVASLLETRLDDLQQQFEIEGKFNARKARLESIGNGEVRVSETSYFRSFCTNFAPDRAGPNGGPTLRESFDCEFVENGELVPLGSSPFSDHLGGGGIVITTDGHARLGVRSMDVTVGERKAGHAFGGNFEYQNLTAGATIGDELRREALEEINGLEPEDIHKVAGLGVIRRVDWLGKPDVHSLVLIEEKQDYAQSTAEFYDDIVVDLGIGDVSEIDELFEPETAARCVRRIRERVHGLDLSPSVNYHVSLELWLRRALTVQSTS